MKKRRLFLSIMFILFWIFVIFYFSSQPGSQSQLQSDRTLQLARRLNELFDLTDTELFIKSELFFRERILGGRYSSADAIIRKSAHFGIYFVLGAMCAFFGYFYSKKYLIGVLLGVTLPVTVAVLDEYNQGFVGRTSSLDDVILDGIGAAFGTIVIIFTVFVLKALFKFFKRSGGSNEKKGDEQ